MSAVPSVRTSCLVIDKMIPRKDKDVLQCVVIDNLLNLLSEKHTMVCL